ncbi:hypothetical protein M9Y10_024333 [Tritrichomonas musculus]|uniref:HK97 gp10 family phage protein n=1 Tax=Tritrichomonas musculus TaxID=1915356 RepID=A0ABR2HCQ8_9EUKA
MFININTRKAYAYPMNGKGAREVLKALQQFVKDAQQVYSIANQREKLAETLNRGKECIIERIDNYNDDTGKYKVKYEGVVGRKAFAQEPIRNLRRGNPLVLGPAEREYWLSYTKKAGKEIPDRIKKYI